MTNGLIGMEIDWVSPDAPWEHLAELAKPMSTRYEVPLLYFLAKLIGAKETVELGIGFGFGTLALGLHAKEAGGRHTSIDHSFKSVGRARKLKEDFGLPITVIHADFKDVKWKRPICLLFMDDGHEYEQVKRQIKIFASRVRRGGVVMFHDYSYRGVHEAVRKLYDPRRWGMISLRSPKEVALWVRK